MFKENKVINFIVNWMTQYLKKSGQNGFIVGISGGIDSAVTSVLCAKTKKKTIVVNLPIFQATNQNIRALEHISWLKKKFLNIENIHIDLSNTFYTFKKAINLKIDNELSMANSKSRIRMAALYAIATSTKKLVVGTGNRIEDYGIGFFTKYGDGGVDISPIGDLLKSQVYLIGKKIGIIESIINAQPTDGLWDDQRTDEDQIGATYKELEWAMNFLNNKNKSILLNKREKKIINIYKELHYKNMHKFKKIPKCDIPKKYLKKNK